jgi:hypothetical protein
MLAPSIKTVFEGKDPVHSRQFSSGPGPPAAPVEGAQIRAPSAIIDLFAEAASAVTRATYFRDKVINCDV